jgi:hypothetical protein
MLGTISVGAVVGATMLRNAVSGAAKWGAGQNLGEVGSRFWGWAVSEKSPLEKSILNAVMSVASKHFKEYASNLETVAGKLKKEKRLDLGSENVKDVLSSDAFFDILKAANIPVPHIDKMLDLMQGQMVRNFVEEEPKENLAESVKVLIEESEEARKMARQLKEDLRRNRAGIDWLIRRENQVHGVLLAGVGSDGLLVAKLDAVHELLADEMQELLRRVAKMEQMLGEIQGSIGIQKKDLDQINERLSRLDLSSLSRLSEMVSNSREIIIQTRDTGEIKKIMNRREIGEVVSLMMEAKKSLFILGIHALGPLHQGREIILDLLDAGGIVRVVLLKFDPDRNSPFGQRAEFEDDTSGRLKAMWYASLAVLRDIDSRRKGGTLEVRIHGKRPEYSIIIADGNKAHFTAYPEKRGVRGITGVTEFICNSGTDSGRFAEVERQFTALWEKGDCLLLKPR